MRHELQPFTLLFPRARWVRCQGLKAGRPLDPHLPQLTFKKDKTPILALICSTDVTGQTTPEVANGHGIVV
jgi:hypothetical protein